MPQPAVTTHVGVRFVSVPVLARRGGCECLLLRIEGELFGTGQWGFG